MKTRDLIAKKLRREKALERKNRNLQAAQKQKNIENKEIEYTIPDSFSEDVLKEASLLPANSVSQNEILRRRDMRDILTFTIDPDEAKDFDDAVEKAVWLEHGNRHSAHIHSKNVDRITKYAKEIDTAILVKNAPSYAALGFGGEGYCTFTIASRTGEGLTSASTFTKRRRCVMSDSLCIR